MDNGNNKQSQRMDRRGFFKSTATLGAGMALLSGAARAQTLATEAKGDDLHIALIGAGAQGMVLLNACLRIPNVRFRAVCDIWSYSQRRSSRTLKKYGQDVNVYEDYRELLERETDLDAAIVATPDWVHAKHAVACMNAGLHVYCEKEMSNSLGEARRMVISARETGKLLQTGHQRRSNPRYIHAIDRMIGKHNLLRRITHANAQWNRAQCQDLGWPQKYEIDRKTLEKYGYDSMHAFRNWRWYRKYGGGPVVDLGSHQIDVFNWVFGGPPKSVMASGGVDYYTHREWYDNVLAIYEYLGPEGVARAFYQTLTTSSNGGFYEHFMGEDGTLAISEVPGLGNHFLREQHVPEGDWEKLAQQGLLSQYVEQAEPAKTQDIYVDVRVSAELGSWTLPVELNKPVHQPHLENFFDAIRRGAPLNCPPEAGYETAVAVLRANDAVAANRKLDFTREEFVV